jgi:hypothetical protein
MQQVDCGDRAGLKHTDVNADRRGAQMTSMSHEFSLPG